jgi:hypothetical protein
LANDWAIDGLEIDPSDRASRHRIARLRFDLQILDQITRSSFIDHHIDRQSSIIDRQWSSSPA